ncbi:cytochrome c maturation protein CcmE [Coralloluteibacterium thermophilus]|uniref:Cytochrome c-type biogenesis protein CcmE n=1 Tax=Coralloluteibacterium thermophilum TaxID=2707049 RepID=A0ABV9NR67_9GAMM
MNPTRKRRLLFVAALIVAAGLATTFVVMALQRNLTYLYTPSEVLAGETAERAVFRLGGMVKEGSFSREPDSLKVSFVVLDGDGELPVDFEGILPDLFRENQSVIATGSMAGDRFLATQVLAKHDEAYMPKEVADKMGIAHQKHGVDAAPSDGSY